MRINTNIASMSAIRALATTGRALTRALERLATGKRINSARDDAAGLAMWTQVEADKRAYSQALRGINDAYQFTQTAEAILSNQTSLVQRMNELAIQAANGTLSTSDRTYLNSEFQTLLEEFKRVGREAKYNDQALFSDSYSLLNIQTGPHSSESWKMNVPNLSPEKIFTKTLGTGTLTNRSTYAAVTGLGAIETVDVDGDEIDDLITTTSDEAYVSIWRGNGDGTFSSAQKTQVGQYPWYGVLAAADINGDKKVDLAIGNGNENTVSVLIGNGDGTFATRTTFSMGDFPSSTKFADMNNDGNLDLIVGDGEDTSIHVRLGDGSGNFGGDIITTGGTNGFQAVFEIGDLNRDGNLDLAQTNETDNTVSVHLGNGDGTFKTRTTYSSASAAGPVRLADFNKDGNLDMVSTSYFNSSLHVFINRGNGTFSAGTTYSTTSGARDVQVADLNGDDILDLVTFGQSSSGVNVHFGNGDGTFYARKTLFSESGRAIFTATVGDFNDDGVSDVAFKVNEGILNVFLTSTQSGSALPFLRIDSQEKAAASLDVLSEALSALAGHRANLGATMNRLQFEQSVSGKMIEVSADMASRIGDSDVAVETAELTRNQILQSAGVSVLGQANAQMQIVLTLLGGIR